MSSKECLQVCKKCPNRIENQSAGVQLWPGDADVRLNETEFLAAFHAKDGNSGSVTHEQTRATIEDDPRITRIFEKCEGAAQGLMERIGIKPVSGDCPALKYMFDGDPTDADVVSDYLETRTTDF